MILTDISLYGIILSKPAKAGERLNQNRDSYNKICGEWRRVRGEMPPNKCIVDFADTLAQGARILDVGCGCGRPIAGYLAGQGFNVVGIDISESMIKAARSEHIAGCEFIVSDFLDYDSDTKFDAVIAFDSLWHIPHENQRAIYPRLAKLLKIGGRLLFTHGKRDGSVEGEMFGARFYYSALDAQEAVALLERNGFGQIEYELDYVEPTTGDRELIVTAELVRRVD
ncbi:MAG TPA: class I SAM-dependent methyltransferase [Firmicutes bacterium]|nr:class I SAM-dependent methyltransferase [Bacillota bacterium]